MRCLARNTQPFRYALYAGKTPVEDEYGNQTGEYEVEYTTPVEAKANISAAQGQTLRDLFGDLPQCNKIIVMEATEMDESSVLWVDDLDALQHDYIVLRVARTLNFTALAIAKVKVQ